MPNEVRNFWKPEKAGDKIEGKFAGAFKLGLGWSIKVGEQYVNLTLVLADTLKRQMPKIGDQMNIEYTGNDKRVKLYDVFINGVLVDRNAPVDLETALNEAVRTGRNR